MIIVFIFALPFLFHFQSLFRFDRRIGDLSYPIYICHMLILLPVSMAYDHLKGVTDYRGIDETLMVISLTLIASVWLNRHVGDRIEALRDRIRAGALDKPKVGVQIAASHCAR